ncbi:MAG: protein-glutamate O-methyltransferase CheR [Pseudomonadales bacterium]|nr:protein-glutamate O-methyltransferase CheR [Pseudomonadales bacterium]
MTEDDYQFLRKLAGKETGIELSDAKREMVYSRLVRRIRSLGLKDFADYCNFLDKNKHQEMTHFVNAITTNLTSFFREGHHFEAMRTTLLPELVKQNAQRRSLRVWSAGCSTGEEPYSLAMTLLDSGLFKGWDAKILATDVDSNVLAHATAGLYHREKIQGLPQDLQQRHFVRTEREEMLQIDPRVSAWVSFRQLNLLHEWPMSGPFDLIFCRNVVIYFSKETQRQLFDRFASLMAVGGYLCIGHSETLHGITDRFESLGRTMYRKRF